MFVIFSVFSEIRKRFFPESFGQINKKQLPEDQEKHDREKEIEEKIIKIKKRGNENFKKKQYFDAISDYKEGLVLCEKHKIEMFHILESNISACYFELKKYKLSLNHVESCLFHKKNFQKGYMRLFYCYLYLLLFEKAENAKKKIDDTEIREECENKINQMKEIIKLKESGNEEFKKKKFHSSISFYKKAIVLCEKYEIELLFVLESCISDCYFHLKDYCESLDHAKKSLTRNEHYLKGYVLLFYSYVKLKQFENVERVLQKNLSSEIREKLIELFFVVKNPKKFKQKLREKFELKSLSKPSSLKRGFGELSPLPHRLNTIERVREDTELKRVFKGKYGKIYNFIPCGKKKSGAALGNIYLKDRTNPKSKNKPKKRWLGKIGYFAGVLGSYTSDIKSEIKNEREMNATVVLEFIANNLYRVLGDGMFETIKTRLAKLPILNEYLNDVDVANDIIKRLKVTETLRIMSKWSDSYRDLSKLEVVYPLLDKKYKFMDFINKFGIIPEKVFIGEREVEIYGITGLLATSTSIGDIDVFGGGGKNTGYICEKNENGVIEKIRIVKIDPGFSFSFEDVRKNEFEDVRDIRYCPQDVNNGIKWRFFTQKQKNEFLEVKLHQLELIKNQKILEYLFFRDGIFNQHAKVNSVFSSKYIEKLVSHIKKEGEIYEKDLFEYKKIREKVLWGKFIELKFRGDYDRCLCVCEKSLEIHSDKRNTRDIACYINNLGFVHEKRGEYSKATKCYERSLKIQLKVLSTDHPDIAGSFINLGNVFYKTGKYSKAFENYEKVLKIRLNNLPSNHPDIAASYNNLGNVYYETGKYSKAIENFERSLKIYNDANHPNKERSIAGCLNNLGNVYKNKGEYSKSVKFYEHCLEIQQKFLPSFHHDIGLSYFNLGNVYNEKREYFKAIKNYERGLEIQLKAFPFDHPAIAESYNNLGNVFYKKRKYSKSLYFYQKSLEIFTKKFSSDHPRVKLTKELIEKCNKEKQREIFNGN